MKKLRSLKHLSLSSARISNQGVEDLARLRADRRALARDAMERYLRHQPARVGKSRIKRLRGLSRPQYRLRVGDDVRVFYDVTEDTVEVLAIVSKSEAEPWLQRHGESDEESGSLGSEG